jgi:hypothetical protein
VRARPRDRCVYERQLHRRVLRAGLQQLQPARERRMRGR